MKKLITVFFIISILTVVFPTQGLNDSERIIEDLNLYGNFYSSKVLLFGIIKGMQSGNITTFTSVRVLNIITHNLNGVKIQEMYLSKNSTMDFNMKLYRFQGILLKHFICGVFQFPTITASPGSIPYSEPAELEIQVTANGEGITGVLVNISIQGISGEMSTHTDTNGKALFAFIPPSTGDVKIEIENKLIELKVPITSWKLYIDTQSEVNEGDDFIVTIRNGTASGPGIIDSTVKFNGITKTTDADGEVTFTAPQVTSDAEFPILATKDGYAEDTKTILVLNKQ